MPVILYFTNKADRTCWPVKDCVGNPVPFDVAKWSGAFRNNHPHSTDVTPSNGVVGGGTLSLKGTALVPAASLTPVVPAIGALPTTPAIVGESITLQIRTSDEVTGADLRQSELQCTHWKVTVDPADPADPDEMLISMDEYPDGYSNRPPSWWVDPDAV